MYDFEKVEGGPIEVTLTWEGAPRALMVQLYWAGEGLAHEDVAPRTGPSAIHFTRPMMEAANYRIRVVNVEAEAMIPFTLTLRNNGPSPAIRPQLVDTLPEGLTFARPLEGRVLVTARRFGAASQPLEPEFLVSTVTSGRQYAPVIAATPAVNST